MSWETELDQWTADYLPDMKLIKEEPMSRHTSFRVGGPAKRMAFPVSGEQMVLLAEQALCCGARPLVIGNGTNLLVPDEGLNRLVISVSGLNRIEESADTLTADAGVSLARLADFACKRSLTGLEFAHGIPGSVGGAVCMNAGAYDGEIKQVIRQVTVLFPDEGVQTLSGEEMEFDYRHSLLSRRPEGIVLRAVFQLRPGDSEKISEKMREFMARRKASQPLEYPSAGSTFKRPAGYFAGTLIDQCGLKGLRSGGAQVSEKHAGFIINTGDATAADILRLIAEVQTRVLAEKGVKLEPEVRIVR